MIISPANSVAAVQPIPNLAAPQAQTRHAPPSPVPAKATARPIQTEILPAQPVALPPVVTALTADLAAGRAAAEAAREAYRLQLRQAATR